MITIIDYGLGNLGSISNMLKKIGSPSKITSIPEEIKDAKKILLPGVGAFDHAMSRIHEGGLYEILNHKALVEKVPFLGICLGMQLLTNESEEGKQKGLGYINAKTKKFRFDDKALKIPHMGWNTLALKNESGLTLNMDDEEQRFYFVHSYYVECNSQENSIASTTYGNEFASVIQNENVYGTQFHPEKSHRFGMRLFANFSRL